MLSDVSSAPNAVPQGWYTDPLEPADVRWWTGQDWTHHVQPRPFPKLVDAASS
ncbi:MAG: DUF2510 domain-containing protein [Pseudolysinimonas sp.]